ncbi:hypothetical protein B0A55_03955 [Friedmanniomyces simplex]|uniref:Terpene synthase n=1 Tax=Friedmanniomyces simplex TaxID=329884 RepID=A0A4V5NK06_9PEZI|nr:hypothetical protein B0A55_03955 [Friedmanniomyces simplex]
MHEWMAQRTITISTRPFMVLFRESFGLPTDLARPLASDSPVLGQLQLLLQAMLGLENDILGWAKDDKEGNPLNAVEVLLSLGVPRLQAFHAVLDAHNDLMHLYIALAAEYLGEMEGPQKEQAAAYVALMTNCGHAMAERMVDCGRYIPGADVRELL